MTKKILVWGQIERSTLKKLGYMPQDAPANLLSRWFRVAQTPSATIPPPKQAA